MHKEPRHYHPDLSFERLCLIAKVLGDTRRDTLELHDAGAGDTSWGRT
jgi:hypothetical protein